MDSNRLNHLAESSVRALPAWKWSGTHTLELVHALNERWLKALQAVFSAPKDHASCDSVAFRHVDADLWLTLDADAIRRAAQTPFLLIDVHFYNFEWWKAVRSNTEEGSKILPLVPMLPPKLGRQLLRETLTLAWHTARSDPPTATLLLGIARPVTELIATLDLEELGRIASSYGEQLRPRWEHHSKFWRDMLLAARAGNERAMMDIQLYGLQLLGTDALCSK